MNNDKLGIISAYKKQTLKSETIIKTTHGEFDFYDLFDKVTELYGTDGYFSFVLLDSKMYEYLNSLGICSKTTRGGCYCKKEQLRNELEHFLFQEVTEFKKIKFIQYVNKSNEDQKALFNVDDSKIVLNGDEYHNKISDKIQGFLVALSYLGFYYELIVECIGVDNSMFEVLGFEED